MCPWPASVHQRTNAALRALEWKTTGYVGLATDHDGSAA
jgi:hypothetical protein